MQYGGYVCVLECRSVIPEAISEYNALRRFVYRLQAWHYRNHGERQRTPSLHLPISEHPAALPSALHWQSKPSNSYALQPSWPCLSLASPNLDVLKRVISTTPMWPYFASHGLMAESFKEFRSQHYGHFSTPSPIFGGWGAPTS